MLTNMQAKLSGKLEMNNQVCIVNYKLVVKKPNGVKVEIANTLEFILHQGTKLLLLIIF